MVKEGGQDIKLRVSEGPQRFNPHSEHYTTPCTRGTSWMLVGYSIRDTAKLKVDAIDLLEDLGFEWDPRHRSKEGEPPDTTNGAPRLAMMKAEVKTHINKEKRENPTAKEARDLEVVNNDLDIAIQDMEDRAGRLRDLLEEEEVMVEQASRLGRTIREDLGDIRDYVCKYLDEVHKQLMQFQRIREKIYLKAARPSEGGDATVDYEKLLEELEGDLDVIHTVPLEQVRRVLQRWTQAIEKEVDSLFNSGTLVKISCKRVRQMEQNGELKIVPAKCVLTLKPPADAGGKCRRKCRMVICGNFINKDDVDGQMSLYASGTSTDALRLALSVASTRAWIAAIADVTTAFLLAEWPTGMPRYALAPPRIIKDSGDYDDSLWMVQRPLYGLRESPVIWSQFRNAKLREIRVVVRGRCLRLKQLVSESELWLLVEEGDEEHGYVYGILVVYVDDLMYLGDMCTIVAMHKEIAALWPTSTLEWVGDSKAIRYLGVEIKQNPDNKAFSINQQAYIADLLRAHDMQNVAHTLLPMPREWLETFGERGRRGAFFHRRRSEVGTKTGGGGPLASHQNPSRYSLCCECHGVSCCTKTTTSSTYWQEVVDIFGWNF